MPQSKLGRSLTEEDLEMIRLSFLPFDDQPWFIHPLIIIGGIAIWIGVYTQTMTVMGWEALAAQEGTHAMAARRNGAIVANFVMAMYFCVLFMRAYGGPILTIFHYPAGISVFMPDRVFSLFQPPPKHIITNVGITENPLLFTKQLLPSAISLAVGLGFVCLVVWGYLYATRTKCEIEHSVAEWSANWPDPLLEKEFEMEEGEFLEDLDNDRL